MLFHFVRDLHAFALHEFLILQVELGVVNLVQSHLGGLPLPDVRNQISDDVLQGLFSDFRLPL